MARAIAPGLLGGDPAAALTAILTPLSAWWWDGRTLADGNVTTWTDRVQGFAVTESTNKPTASAGIVSSNGTTQRLGSATNPLSGKTAVTAYIVASCATPWTLSPIIVDTDAVAGPRFVAYCDATNGIATYLAAPTSATVNAWGSAQGTMPAAVYTFPADIAQGVAATTSILSNLTPLGSRVSAGAVSGSFGAGSGISFFVGVDGTRFAQTQTRSIILVPSVPASHTQIINLLRSIYGVLSVTLDAAAWSDTEPPVDSGSGYFLPSAFAQVVVQTTSDTLYMMATDTIAAPWNTIGYSVNGGAKSVATTTGGLVTLAVGSAGVAKSVAIEIAGQSAPAAPNQGVYLATTYGVGIPAAYTIGLNKPSTPTRRLVGVGDSIFTGQAATTPQTGGCAMLTRGTYPGRFTGMCAGYYSLSWLSSTRYATIAALGAAIASLCDGTTTNEVLIQVGTNDFSIGGVSLWANVAAFRSALASLLTNIRAGTAAKIWVQTLGTRTDVVNNNHGESLAQWRTAQTGAITDSGISNVQSIDGTTLYTLAGSADGLHPSDAQQTAYAANLKTAMGF